MMKKKRFKLYLAGLGTPSLEPTTIESCDYDESINLVRYERWAYDIPTGKWVMKLDWMYQGKMLWYKLGCTPTPTITPSQMLFYLKNNLVFMKALDLARKRPENQKIINEEEYNLFNMED